MTIEFQLLHSLKEKELENFDFKDERNWNYLDPNRFQAEVKYDGERIKAIKKNGEVILVNRRGRNKTKFYLEVVQELAKISGDFVLDGEMISDDDNFNQLQRRALTQDPYKQDKLRQEIPVKYMIFDILERDNKDLKNEMLKDRKIEISKLGILGEHRADKLTYCRCVNLADINNTYSYAKSEDKEGIIIKDLESRYEYKRSKSWLKCKFFKTTELHLQNYTINNSGIRAVDSNNNVVQIAGQQHKEVKERLDQNKECCVVVQYLELTKKGRLRNPSFVKLKTREETIQELKDEKLYMDSLSERCENEK